MNGLFISFEGGDGAGKSTQASKLARALQERGYEVVTTREPGGTTLGKRIRELLLHGVSEGSSRGDGAAEQDDIAPRAEALLFAADRAHHVYAKIRPALEHGAIVISDRYLDSSVAYQGGARALAPEDIRDISLWACGGLLPDVTILLDVPVDQGFHRVGAELDRMESQGESFHQRVRDKFLELAAGEPERFTVIDARLPIEEIAEQVWGTVEARLPQPAQSSPTSSAPTSTHCVLANSVSALRDKSIYSGKEHTVQSNVLGKADYEGKL